MGGGTQAISGNQAAGAIESGTGSVAGTGVGAEQPEAQPAERPDTA
jgi:hypothetical protein